MAGTDPSGTPSVELLLALVAGIALLNQLFLIYLVASIKRRLVNALAHPAVLFRQMFRAIIKDKEAQQALGQIIAWGASVAVASAMKNLKGAAPGGVALPGKWGMLAQIAQMFLARRPAQAPEQVVYPSYQQGWR